MEFPPAIAKRGRCVGARAWLRFLACKALLTTWCSRTRERQWPKGGGCAPRRWSTCRRAGAATTGCRPTEMACAISSRLLISTARTGLEFVAAPVPARDGELARRLDSRYAVSVFPFLAGRSYPFGPCPDERLRTPVGRRALLARRASPGGGPRRGSRSARRGLRPPCRRHRAGASGPCHHPWRAAPGQPDVGGRPPGPDRLGHRMFRHRHRDTPDARQWWQGLAPQLEQLARWLDLLD